MHAFAHILPGTLEVFAGPMYSGKTGKLLERVGNLIQRERILNLQHHTFLCFNPAINNRDQILKSRYSEVAYHCFHVAHPQHILTITLDIEKKQGTPVDVITIDEAQFFSSEITAVVEELLRQGKHVLLAGLPLDFRGEPFGSMGHLLAMATHVEMLYAVCNICGGKATRTQRLTLGNPTSYDAPLIQIDTGNDEYQARCPAHHDVPGKKSV